MESKPKTQPITSFTQLIAWQKAHAVVLAIYRITKHFPTDERFGLIDQMRRAAVSITSNIAEGFGRTNKREKAQFYSLAYGSLLEVENQLLIARDVGYLDPKLFQAIAEQCVEVARLLNGLRSEHDKNFRKK